MTPVIVCDIDEVIFDISPKWVTRLVENELIFPRIRNYAIFKYLRSDDILANACNERLDYSLTTWLQLPEIARPLALSIYKDDPEFYQGLPLTSFGNRLLTNFKRSKIVFTTHVLGGLSDFSKHDAIDRAFKSCDYSYHEIPIGVKKSSKIKDIGINFDIFVDDLTSNLKDVMEELGEPQHKFLYPRKGYNGDALFELEDIVASKKLSLGSY